MKLAILGILFYNMNEIIKNDVVAVEEVMIEVGKVWELKARCPLSLLVALLMQG